jgi:hypothetical protein
MEEVTSQLLQCDEKIVGDLREEGSTDAFGG